MVGSESTVLVTGGAGYIGSHAAKRLAQAGYRVIVCDNLVQGHRWAVRWGPLEEGDIRDREFLSHVFSKYSIQAVLHFAGLASVEESMRHPELYFENNVTGTLCLLDAMRAARVRRLIFSSTCAVYGVAQEVPVRETTPTKPTSVYGESKLMIEKILN
jgi:UDP-arabinose 4-epimerase